MSILAIDTVSAKPAIALHIKGQSHCLPLPSGRRQSAELLPAVKKLLDEHDYSMSDLEKLYVLTGPGSFTGVRVGLSYLKGVAAALNISLYGANHFEILMPYLKDNIAVILESGRAEKFILLNGEIFNIALEELNIRSDQFTDYIADFDISEAISNKKKQDISEFPVEILVEYLNNCKRDFNSETVVPYYIRDADTTTPKEK